MHKNLTNIHGVWHITLTPFTEDEKVDADGIGRIVETAVAAGCQGLVPLAIMGEVAKLVESERDSVLRAYVEAAGGAIAVVAGITSESTVQAIDRARRAEKLGADAVMMAPPRNSPVGPSLLAHFRDVAQSVSIPMVVQDEPVTTGVKLPGPFFAQLEEIESIVSVKVEEAPSPPKVSVIRQHAPRLSLLGGLGGISFYEELRRGATGIMTGFGFPHILAEISRRFLAGDRAGARDYFYQYLPIIRFEAQLGVGGVAIRKQLFYERGIIATPLARSPRSVLDAATVEELKELMSVLDLEESHA